jgi:hypothetical protein
MVAGLSILRGFDRSGSPMLTPEVLSTHSPNLPTVRPTAHVVARTMNPTAGSMHGLNQAMPEPVEPQDWHRFAE